MYRTSLSRLLGGSLLLTAVAAQGACGGGDSGGGDAQPSAGAPASSGGATPGGTASAGKSGGSAGSSAGAAGGKATAGSTGSTTSPVTSGSAGKAAGGTATGTAGTGAAGSGTAGQSGGAAGGGTASAAGTSGGSAGSTGGAAGASAAGGGMLGGPLKYTDMFTMGKTIPPKYKCPMDMIGSGMGENKSPPLAWTGGPADTKSFAIVLFDTQYMVLHWAIWDIPATVNALPADGLKPGYELTDPMGAHQATNMGPDKHAYFGPCSSPGGALPAGKYEYRLYAMKTDKLGLMESTAATQAQTAIEGMMLEKVVWAGDPE